MGGFFSKRAGRYLRRFRKKGLAAEQRMLLEAILREGRPGMSVLEIGCGIGALHLEILGKGATSATGIDVSGEMIRCAAVLAREMGHSDKTAYHTGDFVQHDGKLPVSDLVILDKVVCCYEAPARLLTRSLDRCSDLYALTYPRNRLTVRVAVTLLIGLMRLFRRPFHPYWHDWEAMSRSVQAAGFRKIYESRTPFWSVLLFRAGA